MSRYLVTGAKGFIGRNLVRYLERNCPEVEVVAVGREFDLTDSEACNDLMKSSGSFDYIFHLADVSGNARWAAANSADQFFANAKMSINVLDSVRAYQPGAKLVGFSSIWAYPEKVSDVREASYWDGPLHQPTQHYGLSKKIMGVGIRACKQQLGSQGTMLVLGSVYGPGDHSDHVIPSLIKKMKENPDRLEVWGDGTQVRDFTFVDDQVHSIYIHKDFDGDLLNISSGQSYSVRDVVDKLADLLSYKGEIVYSAQESGRRDEKRIDIKMANEVSDWPAGYQLKSLEEGLQLTLQGDC